MSRTASELAHLFRALKAPAAARALPALAERAREEQWSYERFAEALLSTEVSSRDSHGGEGRIKAARFPARKTLEEFDFTFQRSVKKTVVEHLGQLDFLHARENVILLGPPGPVSHCPPGRIPEFIELVSDSRAGLYACKATVDMFKLTEDDFVEQVDQVLTVGEFYELAAGGEIIFT